MTVGDFVRTLQELIDRRVLLDSTPITGGICRLVWRAWSAPRIDAIRDELDMPAPAPSSPDEDEIARQVAAEMEKL